MFSIIFSDFLIGGDVMFDGFKDSQPIAYSLLTNSIKNGKLSHAYLIDANNSEEAFDFVIAFVQTILCTNHYTNFDHCHDCNICHRIKNHNYPEIKIIETDSLIIKKEQLLELQSEFSRSSIEGNYRIYIIKDCDKMNKQASNCLLKFLEEPVPGIIAILLTNHFSRILSTIVSRCQIIHLMNVITLNKNSSLENLAILTCDSKTSISCFIEDESKKELIDSVLSFLDYFEENGLDTLIFMKNLWYNKIQTREDSLFAFLLMIYFYYDVLKCKLSMKSYFFGDKIEFIQKFSQMNSIDTILHKIDVVNYGYEMVRSNLNINLLMDDIVIRLGDTYEYS